MSNPYDNAKTRSASVLGPTLKFKGELSADEDLLIQGKVEGSIRHTSSLTIGESGHVKADTSAEYIVVEGSVDGDLHGVKSVKVRESAKINGNISSPSVSLVEGATFNGNIDMTGEVTAKQQVEPADDAPVENVAANDEGTSEPAPAPRKRASKSSKKSADAA
jgi:cytoskeletal protein CcmA (bactofilin family)